MKEIIISFWSLSFIIIGIIIIYINYFEIKKINFLFLNILSFLLFNGVLSIVIFLSANDFRSLNKSMMVIAKYNYLDIVLYYTLNILNIISIFIGWKLIKTKKYNYSKITIEYNKKIINLAKVFLVISILTYYLYSKVYGGFFELLEYSGEIRAGIVKNSPFSFLQKFGGFSIFSTCIFYGYYLDRKLLLKDKIWGGASFFFSIYYLISLGGRVGLASYLLSLTIGYLLKRFGEKLNKKIIKRILLAIIISIVLIYLSTNFFSRGSKGLSIIKFFLVELSFPLSSFKNIIDNSEILYLKHFFLAVFYFLPTKIRIYFDLNTASSYTTRYLMGSVKGSGGVTGSIPIDFLSFSMLEGNVVGIVIIGIFWGLMLKQLQNMIDSISINGLRKIFLGYFLLKISILTVDYGDFNHIIQENFAMILGLVFLLLYLKNRKN